MSRNISLRVKHNICNTIYIYNKYAKAIGSIQKAMRCQRLFIACTFLCFKDLYTLKCMPSLDLNNAYS